MISAFFKESIVKRAQEKKLVDIELVDLRKFAVDKYGSVDDRPYGGGAGMIMRVDVIYKALSHVISSEARNLVPIKSGRKLRSPPARGSLDSSSSLAPRNDEKGKKTILTSPKGKVFSQQMAINFSKLDHLIIIAGHYEEIDERARNFVDEEVSLGDFILTGGEIAASTIVDSVVRLIPGVLKKEEATGLETFMNVPINQLIDTFMENDLLIKSKNKGIKTVKLLEYPQYTRPEEFKGKKVPEVLLSGNHKEIEKWRLKKAFEETLKKRPDLLKVI